MKKALGVFFVWYGLCFLDCFVQAGLRFSHEFRYVVYAFLQPACYAGVLTSIHLLLGRAKWVLLPFFAYAWVLVCVEFGIVRMIGSCQTGDLVLIALNSSWNEARNFFTQAVSIDTYVAFSLALVVGGLVAKVLFSIRLNVPWFNRWSATFVLVIPFAVLNLHVLPIILLSRHMMFTGFIVDSISNLQENRALYAACLRPKEIGDVKIDSAAAGSPVGVFIIGESLTRNHMGVYGYARETTPRLQALKSDRLFLFQDLLACWSNTAGALRRLLTELELGRATDPYCAFPEVCSRAGYSCALYSNQGHWGPEDSLGSRLFNACRERVWLTEEGGGYDVDLLPRLKGKLLDDVREPTLVFLHLMGCHWPMTFYPPEFAKFPLDASEGCPEVLSTRARTRCNQYDNSVLQTDAVFGEAVAAVERLKRPSFVVLVSDHGETPRQDGMRRVEDMDLWEIPMVVWVSEEYAKTYPEVLQQLELATRRPLQEDQLFVGLLTLARVSGYSQYSEERDFLSSFFQPRAERMIGNGKKKYGK